MLGREVLVHRLRRFPLARDLRVDKLTFAVFEATLTAGPLPAALALDADPWTCSSGPGGTSLPSPSWTWLRSPHRLGSERAARPRVVLPSAAVVLPAQFAGPLRRGEVPVIGHVHAGRLLLDLRTVPSGVDDALVEAVRRALGPRI